MQPSSIQNTFLKIRANKGFELFVVIVIVFSALVIGAKTYEISPLTLRIVGWIDMAITAFFLFEISIRFMAEAHKKRFFLSGWNVFDTIIVLISLIPIENSEMALVGRLVRIFRVLRMVSVVPELRMLLNSLLIALPQLGYVVLLMFIIFYIYGAFGAIMFGGVNAVLWGDISISMLTLFRVMTFEDWTDVMYEAMEVYPMSWIYFLSFIFLTAFAFLNMVIGIVVTVVEEEHQRIKQETNPEPTMNDLQSQISELKALLVEKKR
jgi:voltage-gated sodium channel